jgi:hypothetical protein
MRTKNKKQRREIEEERGGERYVAQRTKIVAVWTERVDRFERQRCFALRESI